MGKIYGYIGFIDTVETSPGVWEPVPVERGYAMTVVKTVQNWDAHGNVVDDFNIRSVFSIIADPYTNENLQKIKYVVYMGIAWKVNNIEVEHPRLILSTGGVYNGDTLGNSR